MIRTVVFDIGGVLTDFRRERYFEDFGYSEPMCRRLYEVTMKTPYWQEYDRGLLSEEKIRSMFISLDPSLKDDIERTLRRLNGLVAPKDTAIPWLRHVKEQGRKVLYLSNWSAPSFRDCQPALSFLPEMDGGIFSYRVHMIKPNPDIYEKLLDDYRLLPEETVFIDDTPYNLLMPEYLGMHTLLYRSQEQAQEELDRLLEAEQPPI